MASINEEAVRNKIREQAQWHLNSWGGKWDPKVDEVSPTKFKVAGKLCADPVTRARQGGILISTVFTIAGHPQAPRCLTISEDSVKMYNRPGGYTAQERNNTDICSWCGIFALYIHKMSGLKKLPGWDDLKVFGVSTEPAIKGGPPPRRLPKEKCQYATAVVPKKGDIGVIGAREVRDATGKVIIKVGQNHHFIVTEVGKGSVKTIDGNAGNLMEIVESEYTISKILQTGGFYTPIWENCI